MPLLIPRAIEVGCAPFGEVGRRTEVFCVVGHTAMGGQQIWFDEDEW